MNKAKLCKRMGKWIKTQRENNGWTQILLAKKLKMSPPYVSQVELGNVSFNLVILYKLIKLFGWSVTENFK